MKTAVTIAALAGLLAALLLFIFFPSSTEEAPAINKLDPHADYSTWGGRYEQDGLASGKLYRPGPNGTTIVDYPNKKEGRK